MTRFVVVFLDEDAPIEHVFVEFFEADEMSHAIEQAEDSEPNSRVIRAFVIPKAV